ncbi:death domain-containing protein CRADD [Erpetoichthys calabaricus]|uniref:CASP2 and RIPK1 domain containing adaptor with death domain n=1 Tax=Erpetoichthys calabaricus TaxID=27687 RepID=A0A8C4X7C3_ERPCA|nr:death domain-containing protein CRADD [Erpetoichthys calabaricus]
MDAKHRKLLRKQRLHLAKQLIVGDTIVQYLYQENILTESHVEEIRSQNTNKKRAIQLLDILPTRGPKAFDFFIDSIQDEYPWIKTKLLDELTRLGDGQTGSAETLKLPEQVQNTIPTEKQLNKLASRLGPDWENVLISLGLTTVDIYRCRVNHSYSAQSQTLAAFVLWKQKFGKEATVQRLYDAFLENEVHPSLANDIFQLEVESI